MSAWFIYWAFGPKMCSNEEAHLPMSLSHKHFARGRSQKSQGGLAGGRKGKGRKGQD